MHGKKVAQLAFKSMHFAIELAEFYISYNGRILTWYTSLIGWVLNGLLVETPRGVPSSPLQPSPTLNSSTHGEGGAATAGTDAASWE